VLERAVDNACRNQGVGIARFCHLRRLSLGCLLVLVRPRRQRPPRVAPIGLSLFNLDQPGGVLLVGIPPPSTANSGIVTAGTTVRNPAQRVFTSNNNAKEELISPQQGVMKKLSWHARHPKTLRINLCSAITTTSLTC
jgi:hypothetical protein